MQPFAPQSESTVQPSTQARTVIQDACQKGRSYKPFGSKPDSRDTASLLGLGVHYRTSVTRIQIRSHSDVVDKPPRIPVQNTRCRIKARKKSQLHRLTGEGVEIQHDLAEDSRLATSRPS